jgi:hypothetical protein
MSFSDTMTLAAARAQLRELVYEGARCPCCTQLAKVYPRVIYSTMARELIRCYRAAGTDWFHVPTVIGHNGGDLLKTRYWGLMEEETDIRRDDGGRAGYWRITALGEAFLRRELLVPKRAYVYDGRRLKLDGPDVTIVDCLGKRFNYNELMGRAL